MGSGELGAVADFLEGGAYVDEESLGRWVLHAVLNCEWNDIAQEEDGADCSGMRQGLMLMLGEGRHSIHERS